MNEKRKHTRLILSFPLFCSCTTSKVSFYSAFENISLGGMLIVNNRFISLNEPIEITIVFPGRTVRCEGKIVWSKYLPDSEEVKIGVEFTNLDYKNRDFIADFISAGNL